MRRFRLGNFRRAGSPPIAIRLILPRRDDRLSLCSRGCAQVLCCDLPGITSPYLYFGMWKAMFAWHVEDMNLFRYHRSKALLETATAVLFSLSLGAIATAIEVNLELAIGSFVCVLL